MKRSAVSFVLALLLVGGLVTPASANSIGAPGGADHTTACVGDITHVHDVYSSASVYLQVTTGCAVDPSTDVAWVCDSSSQGCGLSQIEWDLDVNGDNAADYAVVMLKDPDEPVSATVYDANTQAQVCEATPSWGPTLTLQVTFPPACIGTPSSFQVQVDYSYDTDSYGYNPNPDNSCVCHEELVPEDGTWGPTVYRAASPQAGYWMLARDGTVYAFGDAQNYGSLGPVSVDIEPTDTGKGYWILTELGQVRAFGDAGWYGDPVGMDRAHGEYGVAMSATLDGKGYYVLTTRGRWIPVGSAKASGDISGLPLNGPPRDSKMSPTGMSSYLIANDGGVFSYGPDAPFEGSMGGRHLNAPVVGMAPDPDGLGYWLVAGDGGVFSFEAPFLGSMGSTPLNKPVVGMVPYGDGYLMVASDGGIFDFSSKPFAGSLVGHEPASPIVAVAPMP